MTGMVTPPLSSPQTRPAEATAPTATTPSYAPQHAAAAGGVASPAAHATAASAAPFAPSVARPVAPADATRVSTTATPRRPINPFLNADPGQRARRLARALISDLVAYHPDKRDEGIRNGTLRQLFRDEIKKSYEEYVEQVGKELAESTTHFQDALNEILAGGRKMF